MTTLNFAKKNYERSCHHESCKDPENCDGTSNCRIPCIEGCLRHTKRSDRLCTYHFPAAIPKNKLYYIDSAKKEAAKKEKAIAKNPPKDSKFFEFTKIRGNVEDGMFSIDKQLIL